MSSLFNAMKMRQSPARERLFFIVYGNAGGQTHFHGQTVSQA